MQVVADALPLLLGNLQNLALQPHLLRVARRQLRGHRGNRAGEFADFIAAAQREGRAHLSLAKRAHALRELLQARTETEVQQ